MRRSPDIPRYPGTPAALDGNSAVIACEREASDAAGAYPITPSTQMGEYWAEAAAQGHLNIAGRPLIFVEPEGEHAAAAVTAGMAMGGLRAANFSSGQGIAYMHESLYAAVGKRLTYVLNMGCRAMTKATLNVHAGHDDYHCVDDTGFFQLFAKNAQHVADLNVIAHRIAETALNPGIVAQDGFLTTHLIETLRVPERELVAEFLGRPEDRIPCPTPAQRILFGETRRRIPELWDVDDPVLAGAVQNQDAYMQSVAAQRPYFFDHLAPIADAAFAEWEALTGRPYARVLGHRLDDADWVLVGQGSVVPTAEVVADYLRRERRLKVGVVDLVMFRPFPADLLGRLLQGRRGVTVLERLDQPLAADPPLARELRATLGKCLENGRARDRTPHPGLPAYRRLEDLPELYSASFGLGSRDLQPGDLLGAVENMLPDGAGRKHFYLGIDFVHETPAHPAEAAHQDTVAAAYPGVRELAVRGSHNPDLMPEGAIAVRMHSIGGWGAITTGKNLASTLFDLLGYHVKANPKYGSEKKGQPTTFYLAAAPEPIRVNCEYHYVDVVLSPDPNVFGHTNALAGLRDGGVLVIQSDATDDAAAFAHLPHAVREEIVARGIRLFVVDAFRIAREVATDPDLQLRMQGIAFQGAFFAATDLMAEQGFDLARLVEALRRQLQHKFGDKGARVVEDNLKVIRRGYDEVRELTALAAGEAQARVAGGDAVPIRIRELPRSHVPATDVHGFWARTGSRYARGAGSDVLADPFLALSTMPPTTALARDMTGIRTHHPEWIPEHCTACGKCWTVCPDTALPVLVHDVEQVLQTALGEVVRRHGPVGEAPRVLGTTAAKLRAACAELAPPRDTTGLFAEAIAETLAESPLTGEARTRLATELDRLAEALEPYRFSLTRAFWDLPEGDAPGTGGLLSITVDPDTCKGCGECIAVCEDDALREVVQTRESVATLRARKEFWHALPTTPAHHRHLEDLEQAIGVLDHLLLDKEIYGAFVSGDGACLGCSEKTVLRLFVATTEALMQPRVARHVARLKDLLARLERHLALALVHEIDVEDTAFLRRLADAGEDDLTLARLAGASEAGGAGEVIDRAWLKRTAGLVAELKDLIWRYEEGPGGRGRARMGMLNATGCSSVWGSTWPWNPYPFPWANHLFQDAPSLAMGVFEAHMAKMARGFRTIRLAEAELAGEDTARHEADLARFGWEDFTDEEYALCPPVAVVGGDGALYDIGFQNLSRAMMSGKPLKVVVLDTQVYSNTGGQACTSGFLGQISDMAAFGAAQRGKEEIRKEIGLVAMGHRTTYVAQGTIGHPSHLIESFVEGLAARRPALFNCYTSCQPEHGIGDDRGHAQARLAVESRAYPLFRYDPARGPDPAACLDLTGNPARREDWPRQQLRYREHGREKTLELPMTFADFAATENRFRKHFRTVPADAWHEDMVPLADYLELEADAREGKVPWIWSAAPDGTRLRLAVDDTLVAATEDRRDFWRMLRALAGEGGPAAPSEAELRERLRRELAGELAAKLLELTDGTPASVPEMPASGEPATSEPAPAAGGHTPPWIDQSACTACDECVNLNPELFAYDATGKARIRDADAGPFADLVKAAERCPGRAIHPGTPRNPDDPALAPWIERARKFA